MYQVTSTTLAKEELASGIFKIKFFAPQIAKAATPGQFVHIKCGDNRDYILRRPFSIHRITGDGSFEVLFNLIGAGTNWLARLGAKEPVDIIGPLGKGFVLTDQPRKVMLVAGGMGVAPLVFLAGKLVERQAKIYTVIGAANKERLLDYMDLKRLTRKILATTEDGSQGTKGKVTDILPTAISEDRPEQIFACGPRDMLRQVASIAKRWQTPCQVALEELMACGVGVCLSCVTETATGYKRVCADGPVFDSEEIEW